MRRLAPRSRLRLLAPPRPDTVFTDAMDDAARWPAEGSDGVTASSRAVPGGAGTRSSCATISAACRAMPSSAAGRALTLPRNYEDPLPHARHRRAQRPADEAHRRRQCLVEGVAQRPPAGGVAGSRRSRGRDRLRLGPGERQDLAPRRRDRVRRRAQPRRRRGQDRHRRPAHRPAARRAGHPQPPENSATTPSPLSPRPARAAPFPRAFIGEQPYWTLAGTDGGKVGALIDEDAAIEPAKGSYSIVPMLIDGGKRFDWANVAQRQSLDRRQAAGAAR